MLNQAMSCGQEICGASNMPNTKVSFATASTRNSPPRPESGECGS